MSDRYLIFAIVFNVICAIVNMAFGVLGPYPLNAAVGLFNAFGAGVLLADLRA